MASVDVLDVMAGTPDDLLWLVVVAGFLMAYMAWGIGANDVANSFASAFGSRSLTLKQAALIAIVFETVGAVLMSSSVTNTIRKKIVDVKLYPGDDGRAIMMAGMSSVLAAAATWLLIASKYGLPVSTTHSAVGGVIAMGVMTKGWDSVDWEKVGEIVAFWFAGPIMAAIGSFVSYKILDFLVLTRENSLRRAVWAAPVVCFIMTFVACLFTIYKGGKGVGLNDTSMEVSIGVSIGASAFVAICVIPLVQWRYRVIMARHSLRTAAAATPAPINNDAVLLNLGEFPTPQRTEGRNSEELEAPAKKEDLVTAPVSAHAQAPVVDEVEEWNLTEQLCIPLVVIIACFEAFAHGANDIGNAVGPFGAVLGAYKAELSKKNELQWYWFLIGGIALAVGLATYGVNVMRTIGTKITKISPSKAFCAEFSATCVILLASRVGYPISTTHASVGAVMGVGLTDGVHFSKEGGFSFSGVKDCMSWRVIARVFASWLLTLPIVMITTAGIFGFLMPTIVRVPFPAGTA